MITRFDHAVIAAADLDAARQLYTERLGFTVYPGGRHTGLGTENAIVRFGLDYIELIGIYDRTEVAAAGIKRASLLDYLATRPGGMLGYCLATDDIEALAQHFAATGLEALGPYAMARMRPDGVLLRWQLLVPGGTAWRRPWPFFIQWEMDDAARMQVERTPAHPNGVQRVVGVSVAVHDLWAAQHLYGEQIGLSAVSGLHPLAQPAHYSLGDFTISLVTAQDGTGPRDFLAAHGEGLYQVLLATPDPVRVQELWAENDQLLARRLMSHIGVQTDPAVALGAQIVVVTS